MRKPLTVPNVAKALRLATVLSLPVALRLYRSTDKGTHGYGEPYQEHLGHLRRRRMGVLEIGVGGYGGRYGGGSLRLWRDWFPRATVVGLDLYEKEVQLGGRVRFVQGDQSDPVALDRAIAAAGGSPTVVIDDGSHVGEHVVASFRHLFPRMAPGAVYVIEDLHTSYWSDFEGAVPAPDVSAVGLAQRLVDEVQDADPTFDRTPQHEGRPTPPPAAVAAVHVYPGIAFVVRG